MLGAARLRLGGSPRWVGEIVSGVPEAYSHNDQEVFDDGIPSLVKYKVAGFIQAIKEKIPIVEISCMN